ncbi:hypothetical protein STRAU_7613 [Streptomyces aurantiacus JA 4570]|uniref:Uncharacterized protein n=1 Tax=Streptomyces aurantiacus JA 4570 TaxID=1286094 RepID=S3Z9R6_9ACTN|nr:hypothetical protein STRAU_7613 [Streptomyces aurantiacus JA 4570]
MLRLQRALALARSGLPYADTAAAAGRPRRATPTRPIWPATSRN